MLNIKQREIYQKILHGSDWEYVVADRCEGKTYACLRAISDYCERYPHSIVIYIGYESEDVRMFFNKNSYLNFANGSCIRYYRHNYNYDMFRGLHADIVVRDDPFSNLEKYRSDSRILRYTSPRLIDVGTLCDEFRNDIVKSGVYTELIISEQLNNVYNGEEL